MYACVVALIGIVNLFLFYFIYLILYEGFDFCDPMPYFAVLERAKLLRTCSYNFRLFIYVFNILLSHFVNHLAMAFIFFKSISQIPGQRAAPAASADKARWDRDHGIVACK